MYARTLFVAVLIASALAVGCGNSNSAEGGKTVKASITEAGCDPATLKIESGKTTFEITNKGASNVSEWEILDGKKIVGEAENVADGLTKSFSMTIQPGKYTLYCPGGKSSEHGSLTVTGK